MDEQAYQQTYHHFNETPCLFSKALLRRCCGCQHAQKLLIAEREAVACLSPKEGHPRCAALLPKLRSKAMFSLKLTHAVEGALPHGKEIRVQCGSLLGLQQILQPEQSSARVSNIAALLQEAELVYGSHEAFPYREMVIAVSHFKVRGGEAESVG